MVESLKLLEIFQKELLQSGYNRQSKYIYL